MDIALLIALLAQAPQGQAPSVVMEDARTKCRYTIFGSDRGLEIVASRGDCAVVVSVAGEKRAGLGE